MDHLGSGKNWDLNRKRDGLFFFPSPMLDENKDRIGSFSHFAANMDYFYRSTQEYSLITNCYTVCNIDFEEILSSHIHANCDITEIRKNGSSLLMYLVKTSLLINLIETHETTGYSCMEDVIKDTNHSYKVCQYEYDDFAEMIDSIHSYYEVSMNLLKPSVWKSLFLKKRRIYTKVKDEPPTRYLEGSKVQNAMIANGGQIEGFIENSIIFRGVKIGKGSVIKNSIIMQKCQIGENCKLDSVILDKDVKVHAGTVLNGSSQSPLVVGKGSVVRGALMKS
jgi:glucose-1-phosphate adenylyltransferase